MVTNKYFNHYGYTPTQDLIEDLIIENIQIHGHDFKYLPRTLVNEDKLFGEDRESEFNEAVTVEMYVDSYENFGGQGDLISKFGLDIIDTFDLTVSKKRFKEETGLERPNEGDLIYFDISKTLFKIDFVEDESPFFQAGKLYAYDLKCSTFDFSHETFDTGIEEIDRVEEDLLNLDSTENDPFAANDDIDLESDEIIDFSEENPFGMPD